MHEHVEEEMREYETAETGLGPNETDGLLLEIILVGLLIKIPGSVEPRYEYSVQLETCPAVQQARGE